MRVPLRIAASKVATVAALLALAVFACMQVPAGNPSLTPAAQQSIARPNDNRVPAGELNVGAYTIALDAVVTGWRPDLDVDTAVTVQAFAERGKPPTIPAPLIRVPQGTSVRVTVRNLIPDSTLFVHGLRAGTIAGDTLSIPPGAVREISYSADKVGTFLYWGTTSRRPMIERRGRDAQLTGAIVVDPPNGRIDPRDRIFVITLIDIFPDSTKRARKDIWEIAVNGLSWPHTERLSYRVGETARWRWVNGTDRPHPMHLHGFHFRVTAKGSDYADTAYRPDAVRLAVTEFMTPGSTFTMEWEPRRAGNWLMHCHMIPHMVPFPSRADTTRAHDVQDLSHHIEKAMAGLVIGITTHGADVTRAPPRPSVHYRLLVQQTVADSAHRIRRGYVLQRGAEPPRDSVEIPGSPIVLTRGEHAAITIVNRLSEPTAIHWHGMEVESFFDGVPGWSGYRGRRAPLIAPGDSFTVSFTPPRAGTYMYHTHMDEEDQIQAGLYAPMIVLEPGERYDLSNDLTFVVGFGVDSSGRGRAVTINGQAVQPPTMVRAGGTYRVRLINLLPAPPVVVELFADSAEARWTPVSKDGADVPPSARGLSLARVRIGVGEAYDYLWTPAGGGTALLKVTYRDDVVRTLFHTISQSVVITR